MRNDFAPDWHVIPGEILEEYIEYLEITPEKFAAMCAIHPDTMKGILSGNVVITEEMAFALERGTGRPAHFWLNLEKER